MFNRLAIHKIKYYIPELNVEKALFSIIGATSSVTFSIILRLDTAGRYFYHVLRLDCLVASVRSVCLEFVFFHHSHLPLPTTIYANCDELLLS